jgi:hypothetical protein
MPTVGQLNGRFGGMMAAVVVVFWSLVAWCSGRKVRGTLVAGFVARWSLVTGTGGPKSGCAGHGPYDSLQPSGPEPPG